MFIRNAFSKFKADFDEVKCTFVALIQSAWPYFFEKVLPGPSPTLNLGSDRFSSQTTSNDGSRFGMSSNGVLPDPASRDDLKALIAIPFDHSDDEDDSNDKPQKGNLFQSLQHNPNASSLSIKSGTSSRAQSDSSKLDTKQKPRNSNSSNNLSIPITSTHSNHSESPQQNPSMDTTLPPDPKPFDKFPNIPALLRQKKSRILKGTHHDTTNDFGQPVPVTTIDLPPVTSFLWTNSNGVSSTPHVKEVREVLSNSTSDSDEVVVYPKEPSSSTSVSHHGHDVPTIQPSVTQTSQPHNDDNLNDTSETNNRPDSTPITQPPPWNSKKLPEREIPVVREISALGDFASDKPSISLNFQNLPLDSTTTDSNPIPPKDNSPVRKVVARRKPSMSPFLLNLATPQVVSTEDPEKVQTPKTQPWSPPLRSLHRINESGDSLLSPDDILARKMEELGRLRRMESRNLLAQSKTSPETLPSRTTATPKPEIRPQLQTLQEDNSSDVASLLREAYVDRQQALQAQLDKALAELRDVQAENKRLTNENQSQQRSISQLKISLSEAKHEQDNSLIRIKNQLAVATSSLTLLNEEKKGWQDKLDSMQHKLNAAERQVRCLNHLTRQKLESRQEAAYGQPKRRGMLASTPASTDVIGAMRALNEEIYQTCVQFVEGLERTIIFSTQQKSQVQKVLGDHLTTMMEDQAKKRTSSYNMLLMQTVLEVFMTHWCSSIIEAFYPQQESFADLLVQLSAQTAKTSGT